MGVLFGPGSTLWLIAHELRLSLRAMTSRKGGRAQWIILGGVALVGLATFSVTAWKIRHVGVHETAMLNMILDLGLVAIFTLMLSQTLAAATMAFFERGDLDLLLSSPIPPSRILTARAIAIATTPTLWFGGLFSIAVLPMLIVGQPRWLSVYAVLAAIGLLAAATAITLAMALFRLLGARRTRTIGQLMAALIGAAFFLISQLRNVLPDSGRQFFGGVMDWSQSDLLTPGAVLSWPAGAVLGEPLPLLGFVGGSVLLFTLVARGLGRRFAANASVAAGIGSGPARAKTGRETAPSFGGGVFGNVLRKELRLLVRDPALLSQVLLRALYILPLAFVMLRTSHNADDVAQAAMAFQRLAVLAGALAVMAGQIAGSLAWITISAEDAPELMACAPVDGGLVRRAKLTAALTPVALLLAGPLGVLIWLSPLMGASATVGAFLSAASAGIINLWFEKPTPRSAFRSRRGGSVMAAVGETLVGIGWGLTTGVVAAGSVFALIPAAVTLAGLGLLYVLAGPNRASLREATA